MTRSDHNESSTTHVVRDWCAPLLACALLLCARAAHALDTGDIVIVSLKGEVHVTMKGAERAVKAGTVLETPATVRTGPDGAIELRQGATSVSVGPDTLLEFPALASRGGPIDRIVQPQGNAFYSIGKRAGRKLRVETPYLVGVVKGTQFNVAVREEGATISLFEGLLEIRAADDSSVVDIGAGEIATRRRGDEHIGVLKMDGSRPPPPRAPGGSAGHAGADGAPPAASRLAPAGDRSGAAALADHGNDARPATDARDAPAAHGLADGISAAAAAAPGAAGFEARVPGETGAAAPVDAGVGHVDAPSVGVDVAVEAGAAGAASADVGAAIDVGGARAAAAVDVNVGANAGPLSTGAGAGVAVDLGGDAGSAASVELGANAAPENAAPGNAAVDAGVGAAVNAGPAAEVAANVDLGANVAGVNLDAGVDTGLDLGLDSQGNQGQDTGNSASAPGNSNSGPGSDNSGPGSDNSGPGNVVNDLVDDVGGLINGQLKRPGKK